MGKRRNARKVWKPKGSGGLNTVHQNNQYHWPHPTDHHQFPPFASSAPVPPQYHYHLNGGDVVNDPMAYPCSQQQITHPEMEPPQVVPPPPGFTSRATSFRRGETWPPVAQPQPTHLAPKEKRHSDPPTATRSFSPRISPANSEGAPGHRPRPNGRSGTDCGRTMEWDLRSALHSILLQYTTALSTVGYGGARKGASRVADGLSEARMGTAVSLPLPIADVRADDDTNALSFEDLRHSVIGHTTDNDGVQSLGSAFPFYVPGVGETGKGEGGEGGNKCEVIFRNGKSRRKENHGGNSEEAGDIVLVGRATGGGDNNNKNDADDINCCTDPTIYAFAIMDISAENGGMVSLDDVAAVAEDANRVGSDGTLTARSRTLEVKVISHSAFLDLIRCHGTFVAMRQAVESIPEPELERLPLRLGTTASSPVVALLYQSKNSTERSAGGMERREKRTIATEEPQTEDRRAPPLQSIERAIVGFSFSRSQRSPPELGTTDQFTFQTLLSEFIIGSMVTTVLNATPLSPRGSLLADASPASLYDAPHFVPQSKRQQWDALADVILCSPFSHNLPNEFTAWLLAPKKMSSNFDLCAANVFQRLFDHGGGLPSTHYLDLSWHFKLDGRFREQFTRESGVLQQNIKRVEELRTFGLGNVDSYPGAEEIAALCEGFDTRDIKRINGCGTVAENRDEIVFERKIRDYLKRLAILVDMDNQRSLEEIREHDLYEQRLGELTIPPPTVHHPGCNICSLMRESGTTGYEVDSLMEAIGRRSKTNLCGYHYALMCLTNKQRSYVNGRPVPVALTVDLQRRLSIVLALMQPSDKIRTKMKIPGVSENRPLVSPGDYVRFRFQAGQFVTEVVGEVTDITIKTEEVGIFLPAPFMGANVRSEKVYPYVQALLCAGVPPSQFRDAMPVCQSAQYFDIPPLLDLRNWEKHVGRCDLRFGLFGGRGFEIARELLLEKKVCFQHAERLVAPTHRLSGICDASARRSQIGVSKWAHPSINYEQKQCVFDILRRNSGAAPYIIMGPPGTGKTLTVVEAIVQLLRGNYDAKILVCAPSDTACDVIANRVKPLLPAKSKSDGGGKHVLMRVNWYGRNPASLPPQLLSVSPSNSEGVFMVPSEAVVRQASVVICRCFVAGCLEYGPSMHKSWVESHFTHVFIDECSQAMEVEALVPLLMVGQSCSITIAGDPQQLSPVGIRDPVAAREGLALSLQERLMGLKLYKEYKDLCVLTHLKNNYRSHHELLKIPSQLFYNGELLCKAPHAIASSCVEWEFLNPRARGKFPLMVYDVHEGKETNHVDTPSFYNMKECTAIVRLIKELLKSQTVRISTGGIAVIAPFRAQVLKMREVLRKENLGAVNVGSVEDMQGQEKSVVFISTVLTRDHRRWSRSEERNGLGFMNDPKRFNVAITRAHALCVVVGNVGYLKRSCTYWTALIEHVRRNGGICGDAGSTAAIDERKEYDEDDISLDDILSRVDQLALGMRNEEMRYSLGVRDYKNDGLIWRLMLC